MAQRFAAAVCIVLLASACHGPTDPSENVTSTFSGTVQPFSTGPSHSVTINSLGEFTISLTGLTPGNVYIGVGWGQAQGSSCALFQSLPVSSATVGRTALQGSIQIKGTYCAVVFDPSLYFGGYPSLTVAQNYSIQVSHP